MIKTLENWFFSHVWNDPKDAEHLKKALIYGFPVGCLIGAIPALHLAFWHVFIAGVCLMAPVAFSKR